MALRDRRMPERVDLGQQRSSVMASPMLQRRHWVAEGCPNPHGLRVVMGYFLPSWQRPLVWTQAQMVSFIESAWRGISLGTYTVNQTDMDHPLDNLLIDGQQRMTAVERYILDDFPVLGYRWSEVSPIDKRVWDMSTSFASYLTNTKDEDYLRSYYDMLNFGGTPHTEDQRATTVVA